MSYTCQGCGYNHSDVRVATDLLTIKDEGYGVWTCDKCGNNHKIGRNSAERLQETIAE